MTTSIIKTVNAAGLAEIKAFLAENHKLGGDHFTPDMLRAWAADAEFSLAEGNDAAIELRSADSVHGRTQTFTISAAGLDSQEFDVWEAWLDGEEDEVQQFLVPKIGGDLAELAASALGVDVSPELNMRRA